MSEVKLNNIMRSASAIYELRENLFSSPERLADIASELKDVSRFLNVSEKCAAVISVMICEQITGESSACRKLMRQMSYKMCDIIAVQSELKLLKRKGWLKSTRKSSSSFARQELEVSKKFLQAFSAGDLTVLEKSTPKNFAAALLELRQMINVLHSDDDISELVCVVIQEMKLYQQFEFLNFLIENTELSDFEKIILVYISSELIYGREEVDLNVVIDYFLYEPGWAFNFRNAIRSGESILFKGDFLSFVRRGFVDFSCVTVGEKLNDFLSDLRQDCQGLEKNVRFCKLIKSEEIKAQALYFSTTMESSVQKISSVLAGNKLDALFRNFEKQGMNPCLTLMFYGPPGTGKTELVKQLAKLHGRAVYQVDISGIKDMWVGESEKNLKRVFGEYGEACKKSAITPILLFNEADALLSLRTDVRGSVDQMFNNLQNILLQELEDIKGVFIATTNLIQNIDAAFDRRIHYKLNFEEPDDKTRLEILKSHFPETSPQQLELLSGKYCLTGGQIQNVKRKWIAEKLLFTENEFNHESIEEFMKSEDSFRQKRIKVGF